MRFNLPFPNIFVSSKRNYFLTIFIFSLFCLFIYFDKNASWIEIARVFSPGEGLPKSYVPNDHITISWPIGLLFFANSLLTMLFGYLLVNPMWTRINASFLTKFVGSFVPGYLAVCAIARLSTLFFPHLFAPILIVTIEIVLILLLARHQRRLLITLIQGEFKKRHWIEASIILVIFFLCLTEGIQWGYHYLTSDGTGFFLTYLEKTLPLLDMKSHFPIVDQHADEILYNYPLLFTFYKTHNPQVFFWFLNAVGRLSMGFLFFLLFRYYRLSNTYSIAATLFLFFGTNSLNPFKYLLIFDGVNPLFYVLNLNRSFPTYALDAS